MITTSKPSSDQKLYSNSIQNKSVELQESSKDLTQDLQMQQEDPEHSMQTLWAAKAGFLGGRRRSLVLCFMSYQLLQNQ